MPTINFTGDPAADELLSADPFALLLGMLLDQQQPMERAFAAPARLHERLGHLDPALIARMDADEFEAVFREQPALHRFPGSMATRTRDLCAALVEHHDGRAQDVWEGAADGRDLRRRLESLPGFGRQKAQVFVAVLAKRLGHEPDGWEAAAGDYAAEGHRSVADVAVFDDVALVRATKQEIKARRKG